MPGDEPGTGTAGGVPCSVGRAARRIMSRGPRNAGAAGSGSAATHRRGGALGATAPLTGPPVVAIIQVTHTTLNMM
jgi:hypothetical protein